MSTPPVCYEDMLSQNARCRTFIWQCAVKRTICGVIGNLASAPPAVSQKGEILRHRTKAVESGLQAAKKFISNRPTKSGFFARDIDRDDAKSRSRNGRQPSTRSTALNRRQPKPPYTSTGKVDSEI